MEPEQLRKELAKAGGDLWSEINALCREWVQPCLDVLDRRDPRVRRFPKTFNDPIWGVIEVYPAEVDLLDSPLIQRLRGVRQLGMAHLVYPGAVHDRLEHILGVLEAAERMYRALEKNAEHRCRFTQGAERPPPPEDDHEAIRFAALLHDIGHGPFSHATEPLIGARFPSQLDACEAVCRRAFAGVTKIAHGEVLSVLMILSDALVKVFEHANFDAKTNRKMLPLAIAGRILGSRSHLNATYLSGIISGPLDADKLDYMARDSHHAGLHIGLDLDRLIAKLEVVTVTVENAPNETLRARAEHEATKRFFETGISLAGLGAYEQLIIARVMLYDRLYYHHKVRSAEAMVRALFQVAEEERGKPFSLSEMFSGYGDDTMLAVVGGLLADGGKTGAAPRAAELGRVLGARRLYHRAYAFEKRFIFQPQGMDPKEREETRALKWSFAARELATSEKRRDIGLEIFKIATALIDAIPELTELKNKLRWEHILVDYPANKAVVRGGDILTKTESGHVGTPNLFFDPERWSQAYEDQKRCGFVFAPLEFVSVVSAAARVVLFEKFDIVLTSAADIAAKTEGIVDPEWIQKAAANGICSAECAAALTPDARPTFARIRAEEIRLPAEWIRDRPGLRDEIARAFLDADRAGLPASIHDEALALIEDLATFVVMTEQGGTFARFKDRPDEKADLQGALKNHLRSRGAKTFEGPEFGGGVSDLLARSAIIENKVRERTAAPLDTGQHYPWQARRYSMSVSSRIGVVVVAYQPTDEKALLAPADRIRLATLNGAPEGYVQIRVAIPWGVALPHDAKAPK